jgi:site-specific recombinase XerC
MDIASAGRTEATRRPTDQAQAGLDLVTASALELCVLGGPGHPVFDEMTARGWRARCARATVTRPLCTIAGFYRYAVEEELLDHAPAAHVRRPRLDYESHATGLDRDELGAMLVAAGLGTAGEHALISLSALNGLRVPEATGANIEALGTERGHRTLTIAQGRQGGDHPAGAAHRPRDRPGGR